MQITPIILSNINQTPRQVFQQKPRVFAPHFGADSFKKTEAEPLKFHRGAVIRGGEIFNRRTTMFFRDDIKWEEFRYYLRQRFADYESVSTQVYGCSSGEEPYSLAMTLCEEFGKDAQKFFPIAAKDVTLKEKKEFDAQRLLGAFHASLRGARASKYFILKDCETAIFKDKIKEHVEFSRANILEDLDSIDSKRPSIIFCRNMWPYVDEKEYDEYAQKLFDRLQKGSIVVLGSYDFTDDISIRDVIFAHSLLKSGFTPNSCCDTFPVELAKIYEKN